MYEKLTVRSVVSLLLFGFVLIASIGNTVSADKTDGWSFEIEPYLLASSITGDTSIGRITGVDVDVDFGDILDSLDIGAMVHFEAIHNNRWGLILDYGFMDLGGEAAIAQNGVLEADVRQGVLEAFVMRRYDRGANTLDLYGGIRWWDNDIGATVDLMILPGNLSPKIEKDWVDPVIGVRWHHPLNEKWDLLLRGDVGGFGVESDFTAAGSLGVFYRVKSSISLEIAYRATRVDYDEGTPQTPGYFAYDTVTHGPVFGVVFGF